MVLAFLERVNKRVDRLTGFSTELIFHYAWILGNCLLKIRETGAFPGLDKGPLPENEGKNEWNFNSLC